MSGVDVREEWVLSNGGVPFFATSWSPKDEAPKAYVLFLHGFAEHIGRYSHFFPLLAAAPSSLHITAFDQRGHGRTAYTPLTDASAEVKAWRAEGKAVKLTKNGRRVTGGWAQVNPDVEFFVKRESDRANQAGKKLFLWGHSMGGGEALGFVTRPSAPPSPSTVELLSGVIASAPLIRQTHPAPSLQVKIGGFAANILPNMLIPTPLKYEHLSHNTEMNESNKRDPWCEQMGSVRGVADMLNGGASLDTAETWARWPKGLGLMLYTGGIDQICDPEAGKRFYNGVEAPHKRLEIIEVNGVEQRRADQQGMHHETHNELEPTPTNLARMVTDWVHEVSVQQPQAKL